MFTLEVQLSGTLGEQFPSINYVLLLKNGLKPWLNAFNILFNIVRHCCMQFTLSK